MIEQKLDTAAENGCHLVEDVLRELDGLREELARSFKSRNLHLGGEDLTEVTQRTLDRLVFMRFLEDKLIEPEAIVGRLGERGTVWNDFVSESKRLDRIYNGIIFKHHSIIDEADFSVDERVFSGVRERLSHQNTPYDFNTLPVHILGSIYERFLGQVIVATDKSARVEEKPEVRKAGGVYYTPAYIVHYIVGETIGKLIKGRTPEEIAELRFADIACGSGSFLLGMYDELLRHHTAYFNAPKNRRQALRAGCVENADGTLRLSLNQRKDILLNNIYGVDLDAQAVEVAQLSLFLKLLEDETTRRAKGFQLQFRETMLPSLDKNVLHGNSLIGRDVSNELIDTEEERKLFPLDFEQAFPEVMRRGGFDVITGNPPYIDSEWMTVHWPHARRYCARRYKAARGNWDIFCVFVERTLELCRDGGMAGLIVPNKLGSANYAATAREVLTRDNRLLSVRDFSSVPVFPVAVYPIVYMAQKARPDPKGRVRYERMKKLETGEIVLAEEHDLLYERYFSNPQGWSVFGDVQADNPASRLAEKFPPLGSVAKILGAATVAEAYEIKPLIEDNARPGACDLAVANSGTIDRFELLWGLKPLRYLGESFQHPVITSAAALPRTRLQQARQSKIIIAGMTRVMECAADFEGKFLAGKSTTIVISALNLHYLLGLLNSKLVSFYYASTYGGNRLQGGYLRVGPPQIKTIPIRTVDFSVQAERGRHDLLVKLVEQMLDSKRRLQQSRTDRDRNFYENRCAALERRIDQLVYELYGLTPEEIALVEAAGSKN
jgi:hypothetical protein